MKGRMRDKKWRRETVPSRLAKAQQRAKSERSLTYAAISKRSSRTRLLTRLELRTRSAEQSGLWGNFSFCFSQLFKGYSQQAVRWISCGLSEEPRPTALISVIMNTRALFGVTGYVSKRDKFVMRMNPNRRTFWSPGRL